MKAWRPTFPLPSAFSGYLRRSSKTASPLTKKVTVLERMDFLGVCIPSPHGFLAVRNTNPFPLMNRNIQLVLAEGNIVLIVVDATEQNVFTDINVYSTTRISLQGDTRSFILPQEIPYRGNMEVPTGKFSIRSQQMKE